MHHYHFRLGAWSVLTIQVPAGMGVEEIWRQAEKPLIEEAVLIGTYAR